MFVRRYLRIVPLAFALLAAAAAAQAAEPAYPTKPVRVIVPYPPGGTTDPTARAFTGWFADKLGSTFVIDNRPGAGSTLGHALGAKATPDGHTVLFTVVSRAEKYESKAFVDTVVFRGSDVAAANVCDVLGRFSVSAAALAIVPLVGAWMALGAWLGREGRGGTGQTLQSDSQVRAGEKGGAGIGTALAGALVALSPPAASFSSASIPCR